MPEAQEDFQAAMPSMMRNMQQQQMQQMVKQAMQPQPAGIEGLPAPNMQNMAEGGVVGFAGDEFGSYVSEDVALDELRVAEAKRRRADEERRRQLEFLEQSGAGGAAAETAAALRRQMTTSSPQVDFRDSRYRTTELRKGEEGVAEKIGPAPLNKKPEIQFLTAQPATGIAQLAAPTQDRSKVDTVGGAFLDEARKREANRRKIAAEKEAAIKGMPDLNEQGIAALKRAEEERRRLLGVDQSDDSRRRWAGIFRGWGGDRDAYDRILTGIANRDAAANQAQLNFDQAQLKLREAQQAKALGQFDRAEKLEAEVAELYDKANKNKLQAQQIEASLASNKYATDASIYNTKVTDAAKTADRMQQARLEGAKLKQQAEQNNQYKLANAIATNQSRLTSAYKEVENILTKKYANQIALFNMMSSEQLQKDPRQAEAYNKYLVEKADLEMRMVKPIEAERNRLAAQVGGGNITRYDAQGNPLR
jgi:hypothetical protein